MPATELDQIVNLCKRRGFIFPASEIYGGINGFWDYGPLGAELKRNIMSEWWRTMVHEREDIVGIGAYPRLRGVYPSPGLSQLHPSGLQSRGCTIRFMLRPAALASTPDWVRPASLRAVSVPCRGKFNPCVTTRIRPQPTQPKGQLMRQPPFRLIDNGLATSHRMKTSHLCLLEIVKIL